MISSSTSDLPEKENIQYSMEHHVTKNVTPLKHASKADLHRVRRPVELAHTNNK